MTMMKMSPHKTELFELAEERLIVRVSAVGWREEEEFVMAAGLRPAPTTLTNLQAPLAPPIPLG